MRNIVWVLTFGLTASAFASSAEKTEELVLDTQKLDMIITGRQISAKHKAGWIAARKLERECPECKIHQPYPGDIDVSEQ